MRGYYNFDDIREQVLFAEKNGRCTFNICPVIKTQKTKIDRKTWVADCKEKCTKGWCEIQLDISVQNKRTRTVSLYYFRKEPIAYVWLYGTILEELMKNRIIDINNLQPVPVKDKPFILP